MSERAAAMALHHEVQDFLFREAELIDERRYDEWLALLAEDLHYFMPIRRNVPFGEHDARENTRPGEGISWFDEDKWTLTKRVEQIQTGVHYAEEPLSRVTHLLSNVRVVDAVPTVQQAETVEVKCAFVVHQNRNQYETHTFVGRRRDRLRRVGDDWQVARREIILEQNILLAKNLSTFF